MNTRVFELRTYIAPAGKIDDLHTRFHDKTISLFQKHNMTLIAFWKPTDPDLAKTQLIYLLAFPTQQQAAQSWKDFQADPGWKSLKAASEKNGPLVEKIDSVFLTPTIDSPLK